MLQNNIPVFMQYSISQRLSFLMSRKQISCCKVYFICLCVCVFFNLSIYGIPFTAWYIKKKCQTAVQCYKAKIYDPFWPIIDDVSYDTYFCMLGILKKYNKLKTESRVKNYNLIRNRNVKQSFIDNTNSHKNQVLRKSHKTGATNEAGTDCTSRAPEISPGFLWDSCCSIFRFLCSVL